MVRVDIHHEGSKFRIGGSLVLSTHPIRIQKLTREQRRQAEELKVVGDMSNPFRSIMKTKSHKVVGALIRAAAHALRDEHGGLETHNSRYI